MSKSLIDRFEGRYAWLSNFAPSNVYILVGMKWVRCLTVEHAYQASKTLINSERLEIIRAPTPSQAKRLGQQVHISSYWEHVKKVVMLELLRQKFSRVKMLRRLQRTASMELLERNTWHDNYWGSCICETCMDGGENWLGKLLMRVRKDNR